PVIQEFPPTQRLRFRFPLQPLRRIRVVQTEPAGGDRWSVNELRVFAGERELERRPEWRLRAHPNPWDVQLAFDNSPVTRWRSWQAQFAGMFVEADFGRDETIDSVLIECAPDQYKIKLKLEGLAGEPQESEGPIELGLRRTATAELKARGVGYLLLYDHDYAAEDIRTKSGVWGVTLLGQHPGARLYRID
ncbi:MAG: hypothetical protein ACRD96_28725, partial [Bryobacteraceae bacterium]